MSARLDAAIVGLGRAGLTRTDTRAAAELARLAVIAAADDAGVIATAVDGLVICRSGGATDATLGLDLQRALGLRDLKLNRIALCEGASALAAIHTAALAVATGMANHVACVFADAPITPGTRMRTAFGRQKTGIGMEGLRYTAGLFGGAAVHALSAQRYLALHKLGEDVLAEVAITTRAWAGLNPDASYRKHLTHEDYWAARYVAEPLRLFDCAAPVNGAIAVIVTTRNRAADGAQPAVSILAYAEGHPGAPDRSGFDRTLTHGGAIAGRAMFAATGLSPADIDICELYDAFSIMPLLALEAYGFHPPGQARDAYADGAAQPGGSGRPINTGGGHLSGYYLQGMTPVAEAVLQARGTAGERQCERNATILVTNEGGRLDYHAGMILGSAEQWP
ncbi:MAG: thiolase family protein [Sphingopyxis sp.]|uniref:thiolase family protein n=1 Tax=Sphingopyxis sp. TaxID=1908224 RepID=UPI001A3466CC|nr:thiolase family protein [Sphingopyxis sp.]MBJ7499336.1 thiolase family protein [Sphingopyxis sp.]